MHVENKIQTEQQIRFYHNLNVCSAMIHWPFINILITNEPWTEKKTYIKFYTRPAFLTSCLLSSACRLRLSWGRLGKLNWSMHWQRPLMAEILGVVPAGHGTNGRQGSLGMFRTSGGRVGAAVVGAGVVVVVTCAASNRRFLISSSVIPETPWRSSHLEKQIIYWKI